MKNTQKVLNEEQKKALTLLESGENVFLTGKAGTGKSFLLDYFIDGARKRKKSYLLCAPTGIAADHIGGATIHRTFKLDLAAKLRLPEHEDVPDRLRFLDILVIDEISMCRIDLFEFVINIIRLASKKYNRKIQVIVVGDFFQLPPVIPDWEYPDMRAYYGGDIGSGYAFQSNFWNTMNFQVCELTQVMRQTDKEFVDALDDIRSTNIARNLSGAKWIKANSKEKPNPRAYNLVPTKKEADRINADLLAELDPKTEHTYHMKIHGDVREDDMRAPKTLILREGARVMILVNDTSGSGRFVNGSYGIVTKLYKDSVVVDIDGNEVEFRDYKWESLAYDLSAKDPYVYEPSAGLFKFDPFVVGWHEQIPMKLAWATTIHKAQGQTYDELNLNVGNAWAEGQVYTALSRIRDVSSLYVHGIIDPKTIVTSEEVAKFYEQKESYKTYVKGPFA